MKNLKTYLAATILMAACGRSAQGVDVYLYQTDFDTACMGSGVITLSGVNVHLGEDIVLPCGVTIQVKGGDIYIDRRVDGHYPGIDGASGANLTLRTQCDTIPGGGRYCGEVVVNAHVALEGAAGATGVDIVDPLSSANGGNGGAGGNGGSFTVSSAGAYRHLGGGITTDGGNGGRGGNAGVSRCGGGMANGGHGGSAGLPGAVNISAVTVEMNGTSALIQAIGGSGGNGGAPGDGSLIGCGTAAGAGGNGAHGATGGAVSIKGKEILLVSYNGSGTITNRGGGGGVGKNGQGASGGDVCANCEGNLGPVHGGNAGLAGHGGSGGSVGIVAANTLQGTFFIDSSGAPGGNGATGGNGAVVNSCPTKPEEPVVQICCGSGAMSPQAAAGGHGGSVTVQARYIQYSVRIHTHGALGGSGDRGTPGYIASTHGCGPCPGGSAGGAGANGGNGGSIQLTGKQIGPCTVAIDQYGGSGGNGGNAGGHGIAGGPGGWQGGVGTLTNTTIPTVPVTISGFAQVPTDGTGGMASAGCN